MRGDSLLMLQDGVSSSWIANESLSFFKRVTHMDDNAITFFFFLNTDTLEIKCETRSSFNFIHLN